MERMRAIVHVMYIDLRTRKVVATTAKSAEGIRPGPRDRRIFGGHS
jgi:hypothetical protein